MTGRWRFISDHHMEYGIQRRCRIFGVSRSDFYRWRAAGPRAARAASEAALTEQIRGIHTGTSYPQLFGALAAVSVLASVAALRATPRSTVPGR